MAVYSAAFNSSISRLVIYSPSKWVEVFQFEGKGCAKSISKGLHGAGPAQLAFIGDKIILADHSGLLLFLGLDNEKKRIELIDCFAINQQVQCFGKARNSSQGERLLYGTTQGSIGLICELPPKLYRQLKSLQQSLISGHNSYDNWRLPLCTLAPSPVDGEIVRPLLQSSEEEVDELIQESVLLKAPNNSPWMSLLQLISLERQ